MPNKKLKLVKEEVIYTTQEMADILAKDALHHSDLQDDAYVEVSLVYKKEKLAAVDVKMIGLK